MTGRIKHDFRQTKACVLSEAGTIFARNGVAEVDLSIDRTLTKAFQIHSI